MIESNHPLVVALSVSVALHQARLRSQGGPTAADWHDTDDLAQLIAEKGDVLLYGGKKGEAAHVFNETARAIALLSFAPGGITAFGQHWEA